MIVFRIFVCYSGWKSLHILIAIIKLSGLNVFICIYIFCRRCRTKKCSSNQNAWSERFNWLPTCLSTYVLAYLCAPCSRRQDSSSRVHVRCADRARMADKHQQPDLPSWYCSTFTNCAIKFSHWWMTHDVARRFPIPVPPPLCIFCMSRLVNTPDSDNQLV